MSIADLILVYLWFVLGVTCVLLLRVLTAPDTRQAWKDLRASSHELLLVNKRQRRLEQDFRHVEAWLEGLLKSGVDGAFVIVRHRGSERFIQFRKYIQSAGDFGLELGFPNVAWSQGYFPKTRIYCEEMSIPYRIHTETSDGICGFLYVNCGKDLELAFELTKAIWTRIFNLPEHAQHHIKSHGISYWDELVDRPNQTPLSFREGWRRKYGAEPPSFVSIFLEFIFTFLRPVAFFGLVVALLNSQSGAPNWSLELGVVALSGTFGSLVFFCLYLTCVLQPWSRRSMPRSGSWLDVKFLPVWRRMVAITLPISSILIWAN